MVPCAKVQKKQAEAIRSRLAELGAIDNDYGVSSDIEFVYFPLKKDAALDKLGTEIETVEKKVGIRKKDPKSIEEALEGKMSREELGQLITSFDVVGNVAVLEIPAELELREKEIADAVLRVHKNVTTVAKKASAMEGEYRVRKLTVLAGRKSTLTTYKESGCTMKFDLAKTYFSPRLSFERSRIADLVKPGERVLVMFAGVGPFGLVVAKKQPLAEVKCIELNPDAVRYMKKNIGVNRMGGRVEGIGGDVRKVVPVRFRNWADRVLMPLPKGAHEFLNEAFMAVRPNGTIHFYHFEKGPGEEEKAVELVKKAAEANGHKVKVLGTRIVRPYAPGVNQVVVDFQLLVK